MFINTRAVSKKIIGDLRLFGDVYSIFTQIIYISFLAYMCFSGAGILALNVTFLSISVIFEAILILVFFKRDFLTRGDITKIKHVYHIASLSLKAVSLGIAFYGLHVAFAEFNTVSLVFTVFMLFAWIFGVMIEILKFVLEKYTSLMTSALSKDTEPFVRLYRKITFKGYEGREERKADALVDELTAEYKQELKSKHESEKALKEAEKILKREEKREKLREKTADIKNRLKSFFKKDNSHYKNDNK